MITHVKGNRYTETGTESSNGLSVTFILRTSLGWDTLPMTSTLTDTWDYGTNTFETYHKSPLSSRLCTSGPRKHS